MDYKAILVGEEMSSDPKIINIEIHVEEAETAAKHKKSCHTRKI